MQKANSANEYRIRNHRLIEQQEIIRFQDRHCPIEILTEEAPCWISSDEPVSLEDNGYPGH
ncbi:hypothetical protein [Amphritea pacifica]|uniref:Uncharacterized protein n=1 Tax=Amphritea pacifica TaxID=2811233 RepID=A0ABS2WCI0_9GAMM|nr:hypothetical protein [Amphritea pacifica]MBN0989418.1 hypothetical protein [Amphritea pacifica]MBN1006918.1 hypothetical protein [Amphritea pacifica]